MFSSGEEEIENEVDISLVKAKALFTQLEIKTLVWKKIIDFFKTTNFSNFLQ